VPRPSSPNGGRWPSPGDDDDGWGPSTPVYSASAAQGSAAPRSSGGNARLGRAFNYPEQRPQGSDAWLPAGPRPARDQRATRAADRRTEQSIHDLHNRVSRAPERGLPWWAALLLLIALAALGGLIDTVGSNQLKGGFNVGIVVASVVAILAVQRSHMFPIVIAPPIVYSAAAVFQLYVRSSGLHDKKVVLDAASNYLVYGFPAIAAATAAVLIIAGIRMISRK
jgi:uncharacterized protein DUF6542